MPGYGWLHLALAALRNVQLFDGRNPVVQTVTFTAARACSRVFVGVEDSAGGASAAADDDAPAAGCRPKPRPEGPVHAPIVMPIATATTDTRASRSKEIRCPPRPRCLLYTSPSPRD